MSTLELQPTKSISYGDLISHLFLWQKAFLLMPLWAWPIIPIFGSIANSLGHASSQIGYGLCVCLGVIYFLQDLLKRKIRMSDDYIFFGFRAIPIRSICSADVIFKKGKFLPTALCLAYGDGDRLKLNLSCMTEQGVDTLLKHIQARNSTMKSAAVLNTLVKCRSAKRKPIELGNRLEIAYQARPLISESIEVFKATAAKWARLGPVCVIVAFGAIWVGWVATLFNCFNMSRFYNNGSSNGLYTFLKEIFEAIGTNLGKGIGSAAEQVGKFAVNPLVEVVTGVSFALVAYLLIRTLTRPNCLIADLTGIKLMSRLGAFSLKLNQIVWGDIEKIDLYKFGSKAGQMRLIHKNGKKLDINLSAIASEDRATLLRMIEKLMPSNQIDHELSQAMMPKSDRSYTEIWLQSLNQTGERKSLDPLEPGQLVGEERFEVLKSIGVGGQGKAYLCRDIISGSAELIVLKETIMPIFADSEVRRKAVENFDNEASLLKSIDSNGVVKLLDYFVEDHRAYLVLEHIDGSNLRDLVLQDGALSEERVRELALQMCDILKTLHAKSIVHRDFTPDNLILNSKGKLKLIDFNVAQDQQSNSSGTIVGKHAYLPPEQFRGKANSQSDLYAFGATLFFLLSGKDPEPISQSSPLKENVQVSEAIDRIIKQATALQTNHRYGKAEDIEADLLAIEPDAETILTSVSIKSEVR